MRCMCICWIQLETLYLSWGIMVVLALVVLEDSICPDSGFAANSELSCRSVKVFFYLA